MKYPYTALFSSLLEMGVDPSEARRMSYSRAAWLVEGHNQATGAASGSGGVRDATQADIRKLLG